MILGRYEKGSLAIPEAVAERVKGMVESKDTPAALAKKSGKGAVKKDTAVKVAEKPVEEKVDTVYIKPEENKAYWVRGDETGSITLW